MEREIYIEDKQSDWSKLFYIYFYSTACFVGSYLPINIIYMMVTGLVGSSFAIPTTVYYYKWFFDVPISWWTSNSNVVVIYTYASGPVVSLIFGFIALRFFFYWRKTKEWIRLYFLWMFHHAFNLFFGAYVAGVISRSGFRHASNWAAIPSEIEYAIAVFCLIFMFVVGFFSVKFFLQMAVRQTLLVRHKRWKFISFVALLPWLTGIIIIVILKSPLITYYEFLIMAMMFTSVVPLYIAQRFYYEINVIRNSEKLTIKLVPFLSLLAFLVIFRIVFEIGIDLRFLLPKI